MGKVHWMDLPQWYKAYLAHKFFTVLEKPIFLLGSQFRSLYSVVSTFSKVTQNINTS